MWVATRPTPSAPWQAPVNLGPKVNRTGNELAPRISPDGRVLYFCRFTYGRLHDVWQVPILPIVDGKKSWDATDRKSPVER